ncbi:MAG: hypothetical protein KDK12_08785 [Rhodobacteraceae bacterium]|nr:hypothetical protein [Paracoccaceae bacterium]
MRAHFLAFPLLLLPGLLSAQDLSETYLAITPEEPHAGAAVSLLATVWAADETPAGEVEFADRGVPFATGALVPRGIRHGQIAAGRQHTCAIAIDGGVLCWGRGDFQQLGDGSNVSASSPVRAVGIDAPVVQITAGQFHTCALTDAGAVWCWGYNGHGQLGVGDSVDRAVPTAVSGLPGPVDQIGAGSQHTCAVTRAGAAYCWGQNLYGQLGDGTTTRRELPAMVSGLPGVVEAVAGGGGHTCALLRNTRVWCWGRNSLGQLGDGSIDDSVTPVAVIRGANATLLAAGGNHSCLVHTNGTLRCWGYNLYGQLGDGGDINRLIPVRAFAAGREVSEVALGEVHSCAIFRQGRVRCWGRNALGHLGDGSTADNWTGATPQLPGNYWWAVASFGDGSCAQGYNGEIRCWGYDAYGQAGDGDRGGSELVPVLVSGGVITWPRASAYVWHRVPGGWTPGLRRVRATYAGSATLAASVSNRVDHTTVP